MGRFDHRYWNGTAWTDSVSRAGIQHEDPVDSTPPPIGISTETVEPVTSTAPQQGLSERKKRVLAVALVIILVVILGGLVIFGPNDKANDDSDPLGPDTAYEACRQTIVSSGGNAPESFASFGVDFEVRPNGYLFTVNDTYRCLVRDLPDGKVDVTTDTVP